MACDRDPGPKISGPGGSVMRNRTNSRNSTVECSGDLKRIQLELQVLDYSIYTILAKTYQPIGYSPDILQ